MIPLVVTARTPAGYSSSDAWSPALEGILAYWHLRERLGEEEFALGMTGFHRTLVAPVDLPLERVEAGDQWWYACSSPLTTPVGEHRKYFHRRFDAAAAERFLDQPRPTRIMVNAGPYKNYRIVRAIRLAPAVSWHCIGDAAEIRRLLRRCAAIGANVNQGYGRVTEWTVSEAGADAWLARYHRPIPVAVAERVGLTGTTLTWGIRPPGRLPENQTLCVLP